MLVIAAHPDDELLGCAGTVAKLINESGYVGRSVILSRGMLSRGREFEGHIEKLKEDSKKANEVIGINEIAFYDFPDNAFDSVPLLEIVKVVEKEIFEYKPNIVFTHYGNDLNIDHRRTFEAVLTACRPQPSFFNSDIYSFFVPSSTDWIDGDILRDFSPNVFVDIEDYIDLKIKALSYYETEMRDYPHSRSLEAVKIFSMYWGNRVGKKYVEPLRLVRKVIFRFS